MSTANGTIRLERRAEQIVFRENLSFYNSDCKDKFFLHVTPCSVKMFGRFRGTSTSNIRIHIFSDNGGSLPNLIMQAVSFSEKVGVHLPDYTAPHFRSLLT
jgi:hypothetical protein